MSSEPERRLERLASSVDVGGLAQLVTPLVVEALVPRLVEAVAEAIRPELDRLSAATARQQAARSWPVWPPSPN